MLDGGRAHDNVHVLVASHSHPAISKGGAEIAAYEMFRALNETRGYSASFLGCSRMPTYRRLGQGITQPFTDEDYVYSATGFDWFKFANTDPKFPREFKALLRDPCSPTSCISTTTSISAWRRSTTSSRSCPTPGSCSRSTNTC